MNATETQSIPVVRDPDDECAHPVDPISALIALFDAAEQIASDVGIHESAVSGAEYALRLWASARNLPLIEQMNYPDLPELRVIRAQVGRSSHQIVIYGRVSS